MLAIYIFAHIVEAFLFLRYHFLLPFFAIFGTRPSLTPSWLGTVLFLQPATLEYMRDAVIDDSRARQVLRYVRLQHEAWYETTNTSLHIARYRPQWSAAQAIRYTVDQVQSGAASSTHGIQIK